MHTDAVLEQKTENKGDMINGNKACENEEWRQSLVYTRLLHRVRFCFVGNISLNVRNLTLQILKLFYSSSLQENISKQVRNRYGFLAYTFSITQLLKVLPLD